MGLVEGRVALVTGGSRSIGRAICVVLAREGATVAFNYTRSPEEAEETLAAIRSTGGRGLAFKTSVTDKKAVAEMVRAIEKEAGVIDILVNNAGVGQVVPLALMEEEDWERMFAVHAKGSFLVTQAVLRGMVRKKHGRILNMGCSRA